MKVLTVKTLESISPEIQLDVHYILKMEQHTDYVFKDEKSSQYAATISLKDATTVINTIIECSKEIPDYTVMLDHLDMEANKIERFTIRNGKVSEKKQGTFEWDD